MSAVMLATDFQPSILNFSELEKNKKGGKVVYTSVGDARNTRIVLQTPTCHVPFGVNPYTESTTGEIQSYTIDLSFRGYESDPKMAQFLEKMMRLDDIMIEAATTKSKEWFGKDIGRDIVCEFYRRLVKEHPTGQWPPTLKVKIPLKMGTNVPDCAFFDENKNPCTIDQIVKGCRVKMILELSSVWFVGNKNFGVTWRALQCAIMTKPQKLMGYAFAEDEAGGGEGSGTDHANQGMMFAVDDDIVM
jgi:hypothetical protein